MAGHDFITSFLKSGSLAAAGELIEPDGCSRTEDTRDQPEKTLRATKPGWTGFRPRFSSRAPLDSGVTAAGEERAPETAGKKLNSS